MLVAIIPLLLLLNAVVGPSSATLMIPRPEIPNVVATNQMAWNQISVYPWVTRVNGAPSTEMYVHYRQLYSVLIQCRNLESFANAFAFAPWSDDSFFSEVEGNYNYSFYNSDNPIAQRLIHTSITRNSISGRTGNIDNVRFSATATVPTQLSVDKMRMFESNSAWQQNSAVVVDIKTPAVVARCMPLSLVEPSTVVYYIQDNGVNESTLYTVSEMMEAQLKRMNSTDLKTGSMAPIWLPSPEPNSSALIGIFSGIKGRCNPDLHANYTVSSMFSEEYQELTRRCFKIVTCNIQAFWKTSRNEMTYAEGNPIARTSRIPDAGFKKVSHGDPIWMDVTGRPSFNHFNFTRMFPLRESGPSEHILAAIFAIALADVPDARSLVVEGTIEDPDAFIFRLIQYGYGYDTSSTSVRLSMVVIILYCLVTVFYLLYILTAGYTSTAWSSATELVLLALQSKRPRNLGHISVGANSMETFRKAVGVRVSNSDKLELVFQGNEESDLTARRRVVPNKAY